MAIESLRDGFVKLCLDTSLNVRGAGCAVVLEGQFYDNGSTISVTENTLNLVRNESEIDDMFGPGSPLAAGIQAAFDSCEANGIEIYGIPRLSAGGSTAAVYRLTVSGTATTSGRFQVVWGEGRYMTDTRVFVGETAATIATNIAAEINALPNGFPFTATAAAGVITFQARATGTVGNYFSPSINWTGRTDVLPEGIATVFAQTTVGAVDPGPFTDYDALFGECCVCAHAVLSENPVWQQGVIDYYDEQWGCDRPQCFGHVYTYNAGTLGQILATDTNSATATRVAVSVDEMTYPYMTISAYAAQSACLTRDNPEISIQGLQFGILSAVTGMQTCTAQWTYEELQTLQENGFATYLPNNAGAGGLTSPRIINDITNNRFDELGQFNSTFNSVASRRSAAATSDALATKLSEFNGLGFFTEGTDIREGTRGTNRLLMLGELRAWARSQVGVLFSEFDDLNQDLVLEDDLVSAPRCSGVPGRLNLNLTYRPPLRIREVVVTAAPRILDNCAA